MRNEIKKAIADIENDKYKTYSTVDDLKRDLCKPIPRWKYYYHKLYRVYDNWISPMTWWYRIERLYLFLFVLHFDPKDTWSLDHTISEWILPRLRYLKKTKQGCPGMVEIDKELEKEFDLVCTKSFKDEFEKQCAMWDYVLDKMIRSFELTIEDDLKFDEIQDGLKWFVKYFNCLWV